MFHLVIAQAELPSLEMLKWGVQIGGPFFALVVFILYFYRRDMRQVISVAQADKATLVELIKLAISSLAKQEVSNTELREDVREFMRRLGK